MGLVTMILSFYKPEDKQHLVDFLENNASYRYKHGFLGPKFNLFFKSFMDLDPSEVTK